MGNFDKVTHICYNCMEDYDAVLEDGPIVRFLCDKCKYSVTVNVEAIK